MNYGQLITDKNVQNMSLALEQKFPGTKSMNKTILFTSLSSLYF